MSSRVQTYLGVIIGMLGWMFGLAVVCLATGQFSLLASALPVGLAASLGLSAMTLALFECAAHRFGPTSVHFKVCKWGAICLDIGLLLLLVNHWLAPKLQATPAVADVLNRLGGATSVPDAIPIALLLVAAVLLGIVATRAARSTPGPGVPDQSSSR